MRPLLACVLTLVPVMAQPAAEELTAAMGEVRDARLRGDLPAAAGALDKTLLLTVQQRGERSLETASVYSDIAAVQRALLQTEAAMESLSRAANIRARGAGDPPAQARDLTSLALLYADSGRVEEAIPCLVQALDDWQKAGKDGPEVLMTLEALAGLRREKSEYAEAEPLYLRALRIREFAYGTESAELLVALDSLAYVYFGLRRYGDAEPLYNRLLALWEKSAGAGHPMIALTLEKMAEFFAAQQRYDEALPLASRAAFIRGQGHIASMHLQARLSLMKPDKEKAAAIVERTIATAEAAGLPDETFVESLRLHAGFLAEKGRTTDAAAYEARVKAIAPSQKIRPAPAGAVPVQGESK